MGAIFLEYKFFCELLSGFLGENKITYVSTPINTGNRFIDWYQRIGSTLLIDSKEYIESKKKNVIEPNIREVQEYVEEFRKSTNKVVIDPTTFESKHLEWTQEEFYKFWSLFIKSSVDEVIFLDGWEYSIGCCYELVASFEKNINIYSQDMERLSISKCLDKLNNSLKAYDNIGGEKQIQGILEKLYVRANNIPNCDIEQNEHEKMKDEKLHELLVKKDSNIAQFISFDMGINSGRRFVHINNIDQEMGLSNKEVIEKLILSANSKAVNIRSFGKETMKGNKLIFNKTIDEIDEILNVIKNNALANKYSIINENIDISDGGVSGVVLGGVIEFSPDDTPKCVEKEGVCSLPREIGMKMLKNVYGFAPDIQFNHNYRVEFSIHPNRQGVKKEHTIIWEYEYYDNVDYQKKIVWPNKFSQFLGDKVFGLLVADALGIRVPKCTVVTRKVAPFSFGKETGLKEKWIRTCPIEKVPGKFYTGTSWIDPFELMKKEENDILDGKKIASIISQDSVEPMYSGAAFVSENESNDLIEGVAGNGMDFMIGKEGNIELPYPVTNKVKVLNNQLRQYHNILGDVSIEWVYDGKDVWLVQLNQLKGIYDNRRENIIVKGSPLFYEKVYVKDGLDELRSRINYIKDKNIGVELIGNIGITSHFGDLLRLADIPSILRNEEQ